MTHQLKELNVLAEGPSLVSSTQMAVHSYLQLHYQGIWPPKAPAHKLMVQKNSKIDR